MGSARSRVRWTAAVRRLRRKLLIYVLSVCLVG
jgi:hypothetical protein